MDVLPFHSCSHPSSVLMILTLTHCSTLLVSNHDVVNTFMLGLLMLGVVGAGLVSTLIMYIASVNCRCCCDRCNLPIIECMP